MFSSIYVPSIGFGVGDLGFKVVWVIDLVVALLSLGGSFVDVITAGGEAVDMVTRAGATMEEFAEMFDPELPIIVSCLDLIPMMVALSWLMVGPSSTISFLTLLTVTALWVVARRLVAAVTRRGMELEMETILWLGLDCVWCWC